jgi:hypothetical protein
LLTARPFDTTRFDRVASDQCARVADPSAHDAMRARMRNWQTTNYCVDA